MTEFDVIIIGGGAAGMTAAVFSARNGAKTLIIEPNRFLGRKLGITGKGRCNVTNNCDERTVMKNLPKNSSFMFSALSRFSPSDTMAFFEELGVPLKTERGNRVFPVSDKAQDIVNALVNEIKRLKVCVVRERAVEVLVNDGVATGVKTDKSAYKAPRVILATGGKSYSATGSTGDGYAIAKRLGHTITPLCGSLVPLETEEDVAQASGLTLKNIKMSLFDNEKNKAIFSEQGEMTFQAYGIGGPLTLSASSFIDKVTSGRYTAFIDFKPALDEKKLDARLLRDFSGNGRLPVRELMRKLLPEKIIEIFLLSSGLDGGKNVAELTKYERKQLVASLKSMPLRIKALRPIDEAIITDGGIDVSGINPKTMESKLISGLYFAGEIIDVTGFTGGFNLQVAFSPAYAAASDF